MHKKHQGFTLIEILVVMLIISIATTVVVLNIDLDRQRPQDVESVANRLLIFMELVQEQAILQPAELGLVLSDEGYGVVELIVGEEENEEKWEWVNDTLLQRNKFYQKYQLTLSRKNETVSISNREGEPQVIFYSSGEITPFVLAIGAKEIIPYKLIGRASGDLYLEKP